MKRSFSARAGVMPMANMAMSQRLAVTSSISVAKELFTNFRDTPRSAARAFAMSMSMPVSCWVLGLR